MCGAVSVSTNFASLVPVTCQCTSLVIKVNVSWDILPMSGDPKTISVDLLTASTAAATAPTFRYGGNPFSTGSSLEEK